MRPYRTIACCVDRDLMVGAVLEEGLRVAEGDASRLRLVHAVAPPRFAVSGAFAYITPIHEGEGGAQEWLDGLARDLPGAEPVLLMGTPARAVCDWAHESGVELLVAAANRGRLERALVGGFAAHLAYHAPCSLLLIHPGAGRPDSRRRTGAAPASS